jgi:Flp pilus assembly protein TadG
MRKRTQRGQELAEFGIVLVLFMAIVLGTLTFAHAFMVANMITHAIRDGARISSTWPYRTGDCGLLDQTMVQPIEDNVTNAIATVLGTTNAQTFHITVTQTPTPNATTPCASPPPQTPTINVNANGCVPFLFPIVPNSLGYACGSGALGFKVNRTLSFHDERIPTG